MAVNIQFDVDDPKIRNMLLDLATEYAKQNGGRAATSRVVKELLLEMLKTGDVSAILGLEQNSAKRQAKKG